MANIHFSFQHLWHSPKGWEIKKMIKGTERRSFKERLKELNKGWGEQGKGGIVQKRIENKQGYQAKSSKGEFKANLSVKVS